MYCLPSKAFSGPVKDELVAPTCGDQSNSSAPYCEPLHRGAERLSNEHSNNKSPACFGTVAPVFPVPPDVPVAPVAPVTTPVLRAET